MNNNEYAEVDSSEIHRHGVFAKRDIPKGTKIIEYKGRKITIPESDRILDEMHAIYKKNPENHAATYIFELTPEWDLDGDIPDNDAKFINHSCEPNCKYEYFVKDDKKEIWIVSLRDIEKGEEITYNYGFNITDEDPDDYKNHPCKCGSKGCVGYILAEKDWPKLKEIEAKSHIHHPHK